MFVLANWSWGLAEVGRMFLKVVGSRRETDWKWGLRSYYVTSSYVNAALFVSDVSYAVLVRSNGNEMGN